MKQRKKFVTICLGLTLVLSLLYSACPMSKVKAANYGVSSPRVDRYGISTWDCIYFGSYWQNDTNGDGVADKKDAKQPIKWRVLSVNGNDAFLLADQNLDCQPYNEECTDVTWETCTLRQWLNRDFYQSAFDSAEQNAIRTTVVTNEDNWEYGIGGGNQTNDKIYLLSIGEASNFVYGFHATYIANSETRESKNTAYVLENGAYTANNGNSWWWLRSPGNNSASAADVGYYGKIYSDGFGVNYKRNAVRPVLHLDLGTSASMWINAGTVSSVGAGSGQAAGPDLTTGKDQIDPKFLHETDDEWVSAPVRVKNLKVKNQSRKRILLSWKKVKGIKGYQIQYATSKRFTKKKSGLTKKTEFILKRLKKKKTYYIRVRAYKLDGGKKIYGKWSKVRKVKIKK